jgi:hypothetical protein
VGVWVVWGGCRGPGEGLREAVKMGPARESVGEGGGVLLNIKAGLANKIASYQVEGDEMHNYNERRTRMVKST